MFQSAQSPTDSEKQNRNCAQCIVSCRTGFLFLTCRSQEGKLLFNKTLSCDVMRRLELLIEEIREIRESCSCVLAGGLDSLRHVDP